MCGADAGCLAINYKSFEYLEEARHQCDEACLDHLA
jgi:hypothetical protein